MRRSAWGVGAEAIGKTRAKTRFGRGPKKTVVAAPRRRDPYLRRMCPLRPATPFRRGCAQPARRGFWFGLSDIYLAFNRMRVSVEANPEVGHFRPGGNRLG